MTENAKTSNFRLLRLLGEVNVWGKFEAIVREKHWITLDKTSKMKYDADGKQQFCWIPSQHKIGTINGNGGVEAYCFAKVWQLHNFRIALNTNSDVSPEFKQKLETLEKELYTGYFGTRSNDLQICHSCGEDACVNPEHTEIKPKWYNEEQRGCHRILAIPGNRETFLKINCGHFPHCF